jgi:uncharacterized protein YdhG (YjbR/CyaY superfamily)
MNEAYYNNIDEYIAGFPKEMQLLLEQLRATIVKAAPEAEEVISYQMPAYKLNGILVYFAAFKKHIGFFPTASGVNAFQDELTGYKTTKGTIQFPLNKPLPLDLITRIVEFRVLENIGNPKRKKSSKSQ